MALSAPNRLVLFDCDGTLVDSQHNIVAAMTTAFRSNGLDDPDAGAVRRVVGLHLEQALSRLRPELSPEMIDAVSRDYVSFANNLRDLGDHEEPLFPGIR